MNFILKQLFNNYYSAEDVPDTYTIVLHNSREALLSVAQTFFENVDLGEESIKVL